MEPWDTEVEKLITRLSEVIGYQVVKGAQTVGGLTTAIPIEDDPSNQVIMRIKAHLMDVTCGAVALKALQEEIKNGKLRD